MECNFKMSTTQHKRSTKLLYRSDSVISLSLKLFLKWWISFPALLSLQSITSSRKLCSSRYFLCQACMRKRSCSKYVMLKDQLTNRGGEARGFLLKCCHFHLYPVVPSFNEHFINWECWQQGRPDRWKHHFINPYQFDCLVITFWNYTQVTVLSK